MDADPTVTAHEPTQAVRAWVAEVWVDAEWYEAQQGTDPLPPPGPPTVVPLRSDVVLVGRASPSSDVTPDIDCGADTGVSRRQARLGEDGTGWWVEDLQSSNGTFVAAAGEPLPVDPIPPGTRLQLADDDQVYVGAWTRLVVRPAADDERG